MAGAGQFPKVAGDKIFYQDSDGKSAGNKIMAADWPLDSHVQGDLIRSSDAYTTFYLNATTPNFAGNFNVRAVAVANGWNEYGPVVLTISGNIYSTSVSSPAVSVSGNFPWGLTININPGVFIAGAGGAGGAGGDGGNGGGGGYGGTGISISSFSSNYGPKITISNSGAIGGGGGGGGGGGFNSVSDKFGTTNYYGGGGGGGAAFGAVGASTNGPGSYGGNASLTAGGGGGTGNGTDEIGGSGGGLGSAGGAGTSGGPFAGGPGGAAGSAVVGSVGIVTWALTGTIYGTVS